MKRRSRARAGRAKWRPRNTTAKRSQASRPVSASIAQLQERLERQARELEESREEQAATAGVLRLISTLSGELAPIFEAILESATRLGAAKFGNLYLYEAGKLRAAASYNVPRRIPKGART
jgi:hypothetical protein